MDGKFDLILPDKDISKKLVVNYDISVTPTYEEYYDMIV